MKYYLINERVFFDPVTNRLWGVDSPENSVSLFVPASQCFAILLREPDKVFSQRVFFEEVWEKNGLYASANTLYQNIAMLRKSLKNLGIEVDVIITIPRQGLKFSGQVRITENDSSVEKFEDSTYVIHDEEHSNEVSSLNVKKINPEDRHSSSTTYNNSYSINRLWVIIFLLVLATLTTCFVGWNVKNILVPDDSIFNKYNYIGDVSNCHLYSTHKGVEDSKQKFNEWLTRSGLTCSFKTTAYITLDDNIHATSVIKCDRDIRDINADCITFISRSN